MHSNMTDILGNWVITYTLTTLNILNYHFFMFTQLESNEHLHVPKITLFMLLTWKVACRYTSYYNSKKKSA